MGFGDFDTALKARDALSTLIESVVNKIRPDVRYGVVVDYNRYERNAEVLFTGDTITVEVKFYKSLQPKRRTKDLMDEAGNGIAIGDIVRVAGSPGNYWIVDIVEGDALIQDAALVSPQLRGGTFQHEEHARYYADTTELPAVGNSIHLGRFDNTESEFADGNALLELHVQQPFFNSMHKRYMIPIRKDNDFVWEKVLPVWESGGHNGNVFQVEIRTDNFGFELRIRRITAGNVDPSIGYVWSMWIHGDRYTWDSLTSEGEMVEADPASVFRSTDVAVRIDTGTVDVGPFFDTTRHTVENRFQNNLLPADIPVRWRSTQELSWDTDLEVIGAGVNEEVGSNGYLSIPMPGNGETVVCHGYTSNPGIFTTVNGFPFSTLGRCALYYAPALTGTGVGSVTRFHIVGTEEPFRVPSHWIMIATYNPSGWGPSLKMGWGELIDHWKTLTLPGTLVSIADRTVQWRFKGTDSVELRGKMERSGGGIIANSDVLFTLPADARPDSQREICATSSLQVLGRTGKLRIESTGVTDWLGNNGTVNETVNIGIDGCFFCLRSA